jgi:hypothetical protein
MIKKLDDLLEKEGMYYIGTLVDMDGSTWVPKEMALKILDVVNGELYGQNPNLWEIKKVTDYKD